MIKKYLILATSILFSYLHSNESNKTPKYHPPSQILVLNLVENDPLSWKEISRCVTEWDGGVEFIPSNQSVYN